MVFLVVKGTVYPDEFTVERKLTDALSALSPSLPPPSNSSSAKSPAAAAGSEEALPSASSHRTIVPGIAHILNTRHQLRLVLMSAQELAKLYEERHKDDVSADSSQRHVLIQYTTRTEELFARLKDTKSPVGEREFDEALAELRAMTSSLYPSFCTNPEGTEAAIQKLYAQHEDPDLGEDTRLLVYHCRAILDPAWKSNERVDEDSAALWFCGKPMEATLAKYAGRNEKSKIIVKVAPRAGPAPSGEPRMRYEDQRALYHAMCERREAYKQLEESELRDRVVQQARGVVRLSPGNGGSGIVSSSAAVAPANAADGLPSLRTDTLRPIYAHKEEREVPLS